MYKCIVIDDDDMVLSSLSSLIKQHRDLALQAEFIWAEDAEKYIKEKNVDLIFTDVMLPGENGLDFLKKQKTAAQIVIMSSEKDFAVEAFDLNVLDYLHKPISTERFNETIEKFFHKMQLNTKSASADSKVENKLRSNAIFVKIDMIYRKINHDEIYYLEKTGNYIKIVTKNEEIQLYSTLKEIESKLPSEKFIRIHRSYTINLNHILGIDENSVISPKELLPISKDRKKGLMEALGV